MLYDMDGNELYESEVSPPRRQRLDFLTETSQDNSILFAVFDSYVHMFL